MLCRNNVAWEMMFKELSFFNQALLNKVKGSSTRSLSDVFIRKQTAFIENNERIHCHTKNTTQPTKTPQLAHGDQLRKMLPIEQLQKSFEIEVQGET